MNGALQLQNVSHGVDGVLKGGVVVPVGPVGPVVISTGVVEPATVVFSVMVQNQQCLLFSINVFQVSVLSSDELTWV